MRGGDVAGDWLAVKGDAQKQPPSLVLWTLVFENALNGMSTVLQFLD